jgi:hypothetical protein
MSEIVPEDVAVGFMESNGSPRGSEPVLLDWDRDSAVFHWRERGKVIKVYTGDYDKKPTPLSVLEFYKETTNRASELAEKEDWTVELPGYQGKIPVRINPIDSVAWTGDFKCGVAVSRFIAGSRANEVFATTVFDPTENVTGPDTYWWEKSPGTNPIRKFLISRGLIYPHKVHTALYGFDEFVNRKLGVTGVFIGENNFKVVFDPASQTAPIKLIATDLCVDVMSLKRSTSVPVGYK